MQKTLEILKKEDGIIIKKLSYRKLLFNYKVPVYLGDGSDNPWDYIDLKVRYFQDKGEDGQNFCIIWPSKIWPTLSKKWRIKAKLIHGDEVFGKIIQLDNKFDDNIDEIIIDGFITNFRIEDKNWIRNYKLNKLLENDN